MLTAVVNAALARATNVARPAVTAFTAGRGLSSQENDSSTLGGTHLKDRIKGAAEKVSETVSHAVDHAKSFAKEAADRIQYDREGYTDAIKAQADKAAGKASNMAERAMGGAASTADAAAHAAAEGNAAAVDTATAASAGLHNPLTGKRGPGAMAGPGGEEARQRADRAAGHADEPAIGSMPAGTHPLSEKGTHLVVDSDGNQSSHT